MWHEMILVYDMESLLPAWLPVLQGSGILGSVQGTALRGESPAWQQGLQRCLILIYSSGH